MTPIDQEFEHDNPPGTQGDCFRATLASLLDLPIEQVPHFLHDDCPGLEFNRRVNEFLASLGYFWFEVQAFNMEEFKRNNGIPLSTPIYHEICDVSPRFPDGLHAVVGKNGKVHFDPHPSRMGLPKRTDQRTFGFLVKL